MLLTRTLTRACLPLAAGALLASGLLAGQQQELCYSAQIPLQTTNWNQTLSLPRFDPNVGVLQSIEFTLAGVVTGDAKAESLDAAPSTIQLAFQSTLTLQRPDNSVLATISPAQNFTHGFTAFDGVADFAGTSGASHVGITANDAQTTSSPLPLSDLVLFQGPPGAPGTLLLPVTATATSSGSGAGNLIVQFAQQAGATVTICYRYDLRINEFCRGDGAQNGGIDCPCGNNNPQTGPGGCLNGTGNGGLLAGAGIPSVTNDTFTLTMSQLPPNTQAWFFQGNQIGSGVAAGHGVRCLRGPMLRMAKVNVAGNVLPQPSFPPLSVQYGYSAGDIVYYQGFYRVQNDTCAGPLNTTNVVQAIWGP